MRLLLPALALVPAATGWIAAGVVPWLAADPWPVMVLGGVLGIAAAVVLRRHFGLLLLGFALTAIAAQASTKGQAAMASTSEDGASYVFVDLTSDTIPEPPPAFLSVMGHFRGGWTLAEFGAGQGDIPDQSQPAKATLVPLVGTPDGPLTPDSVLVVARVGPQTALETKDPVTLRGQVRPLDPAVLATLVQTAEGVDPSTLRGVLLDTLSAPTRREAWTSLLVAVVLSLVAAGCLWFAGAPAADPETAS